MKDVSDLFQLQKEFNDVVYGEDYTDQEREEITKTLALSLHAEVSSLIMGINFRDHRHVRKDIDVSKMLYESVDVFRYLLAILNVWNISSDSFCQAFNDKDLFLRTRYNLGLEKWSGQPVLIVDLDDVLIKFRDGFVSWLEDTHGLDIDKDSTEYYTTREVKAAGLNPEGVFSEFIENRMIKELAPIQEMITSINTLHDEGFWIQLLTARPEENLTCFYDTFSWLSESGLKFNRIDFSPEKYRWLTKSEYFGSGKIICAIDDSPKHVAEYTKHGVKVLMPEEAYNLEARTLEGVTTYTDPADVPSIIKSHM